MELRRGEVESAVPEKSRYHGRSGRFQCQSVTSSPGVIKQASCHSKPIYPSVGVKPGILNIASGLYGEENQPRAMVKCTCGVPARADLSVIGDISTVQ
ncbi:hypothetical protein VTN96DRAFT_4594 [Rasamsonia emersonii]